MSETWKKCENTVCRLCCSPDVKYRVVISYDEAHEDVQYRCPHCGYSWWIDGGDY